MYACICSSMYMFHGELFVDLVEPRHESNLLLPHLRDQHLRFRGGLVFTASERGERER